MFQIDIHKLLEQFVYNPKAPMIFNSGFFLFIFLGFMTVYFILYKTHRAKITFMRIKLFTIWSRSF